MIAFLLFFSFIWFRFQSIASQDCPPITAPPYGWLLRSCATNVGATCYIGCPDSFEVIGMCFRACVQLPASSMSGDLRKPNQPTPTSSTKNVYQDDYDDVPSQTPKMTDVMSNNCNGCTGSPKSGVLTRLELKLSKDNDRRNEMIRARQTTSWTASWTGSATYCVNIAVTCPPPTPPTNGFIVNSCPNYAGLTCQFACNSGYR
jgi:hypothetical protein